MHTITQSKPIYQTPWLSVVEDQVITATGQSKTYGVVSIKDGVTVIAMHRPSKHTELSTTDSTPIDSTKADFTNINLSQQDLNYLFVQEFRHASQQISTEFPTGGIDEGETPFQAAQRELLEETGYSAANWLYLGHIQPYTSMVKSKNHIFAAWDLQLIDPHALQNQEDDILDIQLIPAAQTRSMMLRNEIIHGASISGFWQVQAIAQPTTFQANDWDATQQPSAQALWKWFRQD